MIEKIKVRGLCPMESIENGIMVSPRGLWGVCLYNESLQCKLSIESTGTITCTYGKEISIDDITTR